VSGSCVATSGVGQVAVLGRFVHRGAGCEAQDMPAGVVGSEREAASRGDDVDGSEEGTCPHPAPWK
jgi:hypothetical protein